MKLLAFTDTHGSMTALRRIEHKVKSQNPDLLVCAGDVSIFEHGIGSIFRRLNKLNKKQLDILHNPEKYTGIAAEKTEMVCELWKREFRI